MNSREARAATAPKKRFIQFCTEHGGIWGPNMYPADATLTDQMSYAGRTVKRGKLTVQAGTSGTNQLSPVLTAPSSLLTPALAAKMNVLRGCDVPWYIAHHTGGHLGNYARNDGAVLADFPTPTIDQVMAWSPKFYTDLSTIRSRVMVTGSQISYNYSNPSDPKNLGPVQEVAAAGDAGTIFKQIFVSSTGGTSAPDPNAGMSPIVDRVLADYNRLRNSNARLSSDDRHRLDDHMQRMSELQRKVSVHPLSCPSLSAPADTNKLINTSTFDVDPAMMVKYHDAYNDVIVAGILCDTSRIAVASLYGSSFSTYAGSWHQDVAHHAADPDGAMQKVVTATHQMMFEKVFLDLCAKLDVDDGTGQTFLDNSLVVWTQESGEYTHAGQGMPIITAGSAGGFLKTGNYCDYRNPAVIVDSGEQGNTTIKIQGGLLWQQWLGTALQSMGLSPADYEKNGLHGYPTATKYIGKESMFANAYPDALWTAAGDVLPFLKA